MAEVVYIAAAMRAPIVVALGNRALSGPINIHCDHSDSMLIRDSGAIQLFVENAQEAYDATLLATRLAEHPDVLLPVFVCLDGFTITHSAEPVTLLADEEVRTFVGEYRVPHPLLDSEPTSQGPFAMPDYYYELRHQQDAAMEAAAGVLDGLVDELAGFTGRRYDPLERYRLDDALRAIVLMGSSAGTAKDVVDELRDRSHPVGLLRIGSFRPFPADRVRDALSSLSEVAVLDRAESPGGAAPLFAEVAAATHGGRARLRSVVYGLGGRDLHPEDIEGVFDSFARRNGGTTYLGLRGER
jgi:pyruvate ferredoxin oxidoreductase alpha subunit